MRITVVDARITFGGVDVFSDFSATFAEGTVTALVGPSGSGKSSLLAAMAGYLPLDGGAITLSGAGGESPPIPELIAWVSQGSNALGARTVLDNVTIAGLSQGLELAHAEEVAIAHLATVGLGRHLHHQARTLSGGELQRVAIARALASGKPLVFADEPSANLDADNTELLAGVFHELAAQATIVVATHDPVMVAGAHQVVELRASARHGA